jgi:hypothetical protein
MPCFEKASARLGSAVDHRSPVAVELSAFEDGEANCIHVGTGQQKMKHAALLLSLALALLPHSVEADQAPGSVCVEALEQLETLQTVAPVYKLTEGQKRKYLTDADRPAEVARLKAIVADSCSAKPKRRQREETEAEQLHLLRSPECMQDRDRLWMMERKNARTPEDDLARTRKRVLAQCPDVDLADVWLVEWIPIPIPAPPNG